MNHKNAGNSHKVKPEREKGNNHPVLLPILDFPLGCNVHDQDAVSVAKIQIVSKYPAKQQIILNHIMH